MPSNNPIVWFELQIAPFELRLAAVPGQPVLFGYEGGTWLVRVNEFPEAIKALSAGLGLLISTHKILTLTPRDPERCFRSDALQEPSLHVRLAWRDGKRWAACYPADAIPTELQAFTAACHQLGIDTITTLPTKPLSGDDALREVKP